ncbi:MAG: cytosolic protein [Phycisphaerae bacterium]|nr:cytosolic protein [Phycisphaerae bacterium]
MAKTQCVNIETNKANCTCPGTDCENHGICCQCIATHAAGNSLPNCLKIKARQSQAFRDHLAKLIA